MTTIALAGFPNCGKSSLFNALTGAHQKVANYPGVTVESREGSAKLRSGKVLRVIDLPGTYSLDAKTPDEAITRDVLLGNLIDGKHSHDYHLDTIVAVADATNLERSLGLALELKTLGRPVILALNMMDLAQERGLVLDLDRLEQELSIPVIPTVAVKGMGISELLDGVQKVFESSKNKPLKKSSWNKPTQEQIRLRFFEVDRILKICTKNPKQPSPFTYKMDRLVLHPVFGTLFLGLVLAIMFQAIFNFASIPQDWIESGIGNFGTWIGNLLTGLLGNESPVKSLIVDGVIAGVGSVLVFLPQILLLFTFILALEDSGYMARAAVLMDKVMGSVGLHGRAFIPLLSSYACAIPGVMATRTIENPRDRLTTILVAPLTTCSARLPVYALLIGAFIPNQTVLGFLGLQGLVMFALYVVGTLAPLLVAWLLRKTVLSGPKPHLLLELPSYKIPSLKGIGLGLLERAKLFTRRAGTVILTLSIVIWFLSTYPKPIQPTSTAIEQSYAGKIGKWIEPALSPLGFDWKISVALIPGFAAREVMVGALGTVYAVEDKDGDEEKTTQMLSARIGSAWSLATGLSLLAWYIFAPQCLSTLAVVRRETHSWKWPIFMLIYMTLLAYMASLVVFRLFS